MPSYTADIVEIDEATARREAAGCGLTMDWVEDGPAGHQITLHGTSSQLIQWYREHYDPKLNHVEPYGDKADPLAVSDIRVWEAMNAG